VAPAPKPVVFTVENSGGHWLFEGGGPGVDVIEKFFLIVHALALTAAGGLLRFCAFSPKRNCAQLRATCWIFRPAQARKGRDIAGTISRASSRYHAHYS